MNAGGFFFSWLFMVISVFSVGSLVHDAYRTFTGQTTNHQNRPETTPHATGLRIVFSIALWIGLGALGFWLRR